MVIIKDNINYSNVKFGRFVNALLDDNRISPLAFRLMCRLMNCNSKLYHPTIKSLAKQFNVDTNTIDRAVKELKRFGYLVSSGNKHNTVWNIHPIPIKF